MAIKPIFEQVAELKASLTNLSVVDLCDQLRSASPPLLLDIRELQEQVDLGTLPNAKHVPRGMLEFWADPASPYARDYFKEAQPMVVFCAGGGRSAFAAQALIDMGYQDVAHLEAGFNGWAKAGQPVQEVASTSRWMRRPDPAIDPRPSAWIGHQLLAVSDPVASKAFFLKLGLRDAEPESSTPILELRGGTHLILMLNSGSDRNLSASFDLMVDDIDTTHTAWSDAKLNPSVIERDSVHRFFYLEEPGGIRIRVNSSHVSDLPV
jgi:rhodanese-related sulfurtransferase